MSVFRLAVFVLLMVPRLLNGGPEMELRFSVSPQEYRPGDLIEVKASGVSSTFSNLSIQLPERDSLALIAHFKEPSKYQNGKYNVGETWVFQAIHSGEILFEDLEASIETETGSTWRELPDLRINVKPYASIEDSDAPERLPGWREDEARGADWKWWLPLALLIIGIAIVLRRRLEQTASIEMAEKEPDLYELARALAADQFPRELMESFLADEGSTLSVDLRSELEAAVYAKNYDRARLCAQLEKEGILL